MTKVPLAPVRYAIAGLIAMASAMGIGRFVYTPILPGMMEGLGLSASDAGLIASANYAGYLAGAVMAGGRWAHGHERAAMLGALAASALCAAAMAFTHQLGAFLVIRFLGGMASAFVMVFLTLIVFSHFAAAGRSELQAVHFGGVGVGIAVSGLMSGMLALAGADWRQGWLWAGALSGAAFFAVLRLVRHGPIEAGRDEPEPALPDSRPLRRLILAYGLFGLGYVVTATFLVAIIRQGDGGKLFEASVWLITGLAGAPSVWLWGRLARRRGHAVAFAGGCLVLALGVVASVGLDTRVGPLTGGVLVGGTFIAVTAFGLGATRQLAGAAPRRALAMMTAAFGLGQILGPIAAGAAADRTGTFLLPSLGAAAALIVAAAIVWPGSRR